MSDYAVKMNLEKYTEVCFYIENPKVMAVAEKMEELCQDAYMNGYNWEAFFNCYLAQNAPELLEDMHTDPEAGMYVAYYDLTPENEAKADKFNELIHKLVEEPELLYDFMREHAWDVEWDYCRLKLLRKTKSNILICCCWLTNRKV